MTDSSLPQGRHDWRIVAACALLLECASSLSAQMIILNHADSLVGREIDGERAEELVGRVKFTQGKTVVTCKRAVRYPAKNKLELMGEVEVLDSAVRMVGNRGLYFGDGKIAEAFDRVTVEDGTTTVNSDYGKYSMGEKKAYFKDHVTVRDSGSVLTAKEVFYEREPQHLTALGNVVITNASNGMTFSSNRFDNFRQLRYSTLTGHPRLIQADTSANAPPETLTVTAGVFETYQDSNATLIASDSVVITRAGLAAVAGMSVFYTKLDSIVLRKSPFIWYSVDGKDHNQVSGDSIFLKLRDRKLDRADVRGSARAISRADSAFPKRFNQMTGQEIILQFQNQKVRQLDVDKTATSLYYLFDGRNGNGVNKTSGDHVTITFHDGKVDKLKIVAGVEGQFFPERVIRNHESDFNLPGFKWREDRPGRK